MIEFAMAGIASLTLLISTVQLAMGMWNYHTMAHASHEVTRFVSMRGKGCWIAGNTCAVTVGDIASKFKQTAIGLPANKVQITLVTDSGAETACNPLSSCLTNTALWPPASNKDYNPGKNITLRVRYVQGSAMALIWPGAMGQKIGSIALTANSSQKILF